VVTALTRVENGIDLRDEWTRERVEFVRKQYCGGAPDAVASAFIDICQRRRLAPEEKHAYLTKRGDGWVIQTGIDGYRLIADRTRAYAGSDDPVFDAEDADHPNKATVTVWKMVGGQRCPFTASARWSEYCPADRRQGFMWTKMPYLMLGKCAEGLALRKAFPAELSGIYTDAEMDQAGRSTRADSLPDRQIEQWGETERIGPGDFDTGDAPLEDDEIIDGETGEIVQESFVPPPVQAAGGRMTKEQGQLITDIAGQLGWDKAKIQAFSGEVTGLTNAALLREDQAKDLIQHLLAELHARKGVPM
jgi:phage recombination protein Bet